MKTDFCGDPSESVPFLSRCKARFNTARDNITFTQPQPSSAPFLENNEARPTLVPPSPSPQIATPSRSRSPSPVKLPSFPQVASALKDLFVAVADEKSAKLLGNANHRILKDLR